MTHGDLFLPLDPNNPQSPILYCEAWSDGYLDGVGLGAWCSSQRIQEISTLSAIFAGSPFFFNPETGTYVAKEGDFLLEGYDDLLDLDDEKQLALYNSAEDTLQLIEQNKYEEALLTDFSKLPLQDKLDRALGINAYVTPLQEAWAQFCENAEVLDTQQAARICADYLLSESLEASDGDFDTQNGYFWNEGQFWVQAEINDTPYVLPLAFAHAVLGDGDGCFGATASYLADMTPQDHANILALTVALKDLEAPQSLLFKGFSSSFLTSLFEQSMLDQNLPQTTIKGSRHLM